MKKQWLVGLAAFTMTGLALAGGPGAARKRVEASMLVNGDITVAPDGSVTGYTIDRKDRVPAEVVSLIDEAVPKWRFQPVVREGHPVAASAHMSLRLIAKRESPDSKSFIARIAGASFGESGKGGEEIMTDKRIPPSYPAMAVASGVEGTVYLLVRVDRDGKVADVSAEQVNLGVVGSDIEMSKWRNALANPAVRVAKDWTFTIPTKGPHANDPEYVVRIPIVYHLNRGAGTRQDTYGTWESYVPGPKLDVAWKTDDAGSADALPDDGLFLVNSGLKLTTPLGS